MDNTEKMIYGIIVVFMLFRYYNRYRKYINDQLKLTWPPEIDICPDYWEDIGNNRCKNNIGLGKCYNQRNNNIMNFGKDYLKTKEQKCKWTKACGLSWEGVDITC